MDPLTIEIENLIKLLKSTYPEASNELKQAYEFSYTTTSELIGIIFDRVEEVFSKYEITEKDLVNSAESLKTNLTKRFELKG